MAAPLSPDLRERIIAAVKAGESIRKVAARFAVHFNTVMRLVKRLREAGTLDPLPHGGGREPILTPDDLAYLEVLVEKFPGSTLEDLREKLGVPCCLMTIWRALQKLKITHKVIFKQAEERDEPANQERRRQFEREARRLRPDCCVFLDESGINTGMGPGYGWAKRGKRAVGKAPGHWESLTIIGAIREGEVFAPMAYPGGTSSETFVQYVTEVLAPELRKGDVVIMDNLSAHKDERARLAIEAVGAKVLFLPPYSPDLNPIEKMWSKVKGVLRKLKARTIDALHEALSDALREVTDKDILKWFKWCKVYPTRA